MKIANNGQFERPSWTICGIKSWTQVRQLILLDRILQHINYSDPWKATTFSFQNMKAVSLYLNPL